MPKKKSRTSEVEKILFSIARVLAIIGADIAIVGIIILSINFFSNNDSTTHVSLSDIKKNASYGSLKSENVTQPQISIPPEAAEVFAGSSDILTSWIKDLSKDEADDFLENLSMVIREATKENKSDLYIASLVDEYKTLKFKKLYSSKFDKYESTVTKGAILAAVLGLAFFTTLMTLVLVMLAIERNTRIECGYNQQEENNDYS